MIPMIPKAAKGVVVLKDGCLSTYKILRGDYKEDHKKQLEGMVCGMSDKYFVRLDGRTEVIGKVCSTWEEAVEWTHSFKIHPDEDPLFPGTYQIPLGEKTDTPYILKDGEHLLTYFGNAYMAPEMGNPYLV